jgi:hypothetical protein
MDLTHKELRKRIALMATTRGPIQKRWDFYNNDVAREPYFPRLTDEMDDEYKRRFKIGVGWPGALANRLATYFRKGPIEVNFDIDGDPTHERAEEAATAWADTAGYNNYESFMVDVARDAGVGCEGFTKQRIRFWDPETKARLQTAGKKKAWEGQARIDRVNNTFVYMIWTIYGPIFVEGWVRTPAGDYVLSGDSTTTAEDAEVRDFEDIEAIRPASYNPVTGDLLKASGWAIYENGAEAYNKPVQYGLAPFQRFANMVSRPENETGISDIDWAIPLAHAVNHIISGAVRSVHYHGWPQMWVSGLSDEQNVQRGPESLMILPETSEGKPAKIGTLTWDQNLSGAMELQQTLTDFMAAITGVPKHMMADMEGAGKVVSGVALRLMYKNMDEACKLKEAGFRPAEERMIKSCLDILAYHNNKKGYFDQVNVSVKYNPDRTPRDRSAELDEDLKLLSMKVHNLLDMTLKWKGTELGLDTYDDVLKYAEKGAEYEAKLRAVKAKHQTPEEKALAEAARLAAEGPDKPAEPKADPEVKKEDDSAPAAG